MTLILRQREPQASDLQAAADAIAASLNALHPGYRFAPVRPITAEPKAK